MAPRRDRADATASGTRAAPAPGTGPAPGARPALPDRRKPPKIGFRLTREGRVFVLVTLGVGVGAVNTGNNLLFLLLGFFLSLLVLSGVMSEIVLRRVRLARRVPGRLFAGGTGLVEIALANDKRRLSSFSLEVEDVAEGVPTERRCYFLKVAPGATQVATYRRTPRARGLLRLRALRVATRYPFGLVEKTRLHDAPDDVIVYPALGAVGPGALDAALDGDAAGARPGPGIEVAGLRGLRDGDEARVVHWRRSAALGRVVVKERLRDEGAHVAITLDNARPAAADASAQAAADWHAAFEARISRAATLAARALGRGASVEVLTRGARSPLLRPGDAPDPIWRFLALLEAVPADRAPPLAASAAPAGRPAPVRPGPRPREGARAREASPPREGGRRREVRA